MSNSVMEYNDWDAVAALQAIATYFLLRLSETDDDATDFDIPLIRTMIVCEPLLYRILLNDITEQQISSRVKGLSIKYWNPSSDSSPSWQGWILAESLRRYSSHH